MVKFSKYILFPDDLKVFKVIQTVKDYVALQMDISNIFESCLKYNVYLNKKCFVMPLMRA